MRGYIDEFVLANLRNRELSNLILMGSNNYETIVLERRRYCISKSLREESFN